MGFMASIALQASSSDDLELSMKFEKTYSNSISQSSTECLVAQAMLSPKKPLRKNIKSFQSVAASFSPVQERFFTPSLSPIQECFFTSEIAQAPIIAAKAGWNKFVINELLQRMHEHSQSVDVTNEILSETKAAYSKLHSLSSLRYVSACEVERIRKMREDAQNDSLSTKDGFPF